MINFGNIGLFFIMNELSLLFKNTIINRVVIRKNKTKLCQWMHYNLICVIKFHFGIIRPVQGGWSNGIQEHINWFGITLYDIYFASQLPLEENHVTHKMMSCQNDVMSDHPPPYEDISVYYFLVQSRFTREYNEEIKKRNIG